MKIHFSNVNWKSQSGPNTFASRLSIELSKMGHKIVEKDDDYDIFLCFIAPSSMPHEGTKIIQRLDGIWFKPEQFITHNFEIKRMYDMSNHVIWQSDFDKKMITKWWGERSGSVIGNGIELKCQQKIPKNGFFSHSPLFVSSSQWHPQKRLKNNILLFNKIREIHRSAGLIVLGSIDNQTMKSLEKIELANVAFAGNISHEDCLRIYASADWMIHLAWLDHCPNVVIEALSQGCNVICASEGGTKEIVKSNGIIIEENKYNFELLDYDNPPEVNIDNFVLKDKIKIDPSYLDIKLIAKRYEEVILSL